MFPMHYAAAGPRRGGCSSGSSRPRAPTSSKSRSAPLLDARARRPHDPAPDPRLDELDVKVVDAARPALAAPDVRPTRRDRPAPARVEASRFLLLDLADFLARHVPALWTRGPAGAPSRRRPALRDAYRRCSTRRRRRTGGARRGGGALRRRLGRARARSGATTDQPPDAARSTCSARPIDARARCGPRWSARAAGRARPRAADEPPQRVRVAEARPARRRRATSSAASTGGRTAARCTATCVSDADRAVRDRRRSSTSTRPARPIHIALPIDTTIAGLRKLPKNVALPDLRRAARADAAASPTLKKALDGELGDGEPLDLGMICSFSIPIITICALIVLIIFVILLNIVFWWLPFFRICFPIAAEGEELTMDAGHGPRPRDQLPAARRRRTGASPGRRASRTSASRSEIILHDRAAASGCGCRDFGGGLGALPVRAEHDDDPPPDRGPDRQGARRRGSRASRVEAVDVEADPTTPRPRSPPIVYRLVATQAPGARRA